MLRSKRKWIILLALLLALSGMVISNALAAPDVVSVQWTGQATYTYDGQPHGPTPNVPGYSLGADYYGIEISETEPGDYQAIVLSYDPEVLELYNNFFDYSIVAPAATNKTVTWNGGNTYTYNGQPQGPTASAEGVTLQVSGNLNTNAGTYTATASTTDSGVTLENATYTYTIAPKEVAVQWNGDSFTYNGQEQGPTASAEGVTLTVSGKGTNAGNYTATASTADTNYTLTNTTKAYTIAKKETAVVWTGDSFTYNGQEQGPTASAEGVTLQVSGNLNTNAGNYNATASTTDTNYTLTNTTKAYTIAPKEVAVTWTGETTYIYDGSGHGGTPTVPGLSYGTDYLTGNTSCDIAGTFTAFVMLLNQNYTLTNERFTFTIRPAEVAVTWTGDSFTYNGQQQGPTASAEGPELTVSGLGTNAGDYTASASTTNTNYTLTNATKAYTIAPKEVAVQWSNVGPFTYNGQQQGPTASAEGPELTVSGLGTNAGDYIASASTTDTNYTLTNTTHEYAITKRTINVTADAVSKVFGDPDPTLTYTVEAGYEAEVTGVVLTREEGNDQGTYRIFLSNISTTNNVVANYIPAVLTITPKSVEVQWNGDSFIYNGEEQGPTASAEGVTNLSVTGDDNVDVGSYTATASTTDENYTLTNTTKTYTIDVRPVTLTPDNNQAKTYGDDDPTLTYTLSEPDFAADVTGALAREEGNDVGTYAITQGTIASTNLNITFTPNVQFNITQRAVTLTPDSNQAKTYGDDDPTLTYTLSEPEFAADVTGALAREEGNDVGEYAITLGTIASTNLNLTFTENVQFSITKRAITLTPTAGQFKIFDTADPELTYTLSEEEYRDQITEGTRLAREKETDTITGTTIGDGQKVGNYAITLGTIASDNLEITLTEGVQFEIKARTVTVTPDAGQQKVFDAADPDEFTYTVDMGQGALSTEDTYKVWLGELTREGAEDAIDNEGTIPNGQKIGTFAFIWPNDVPAERENLTVNLNDETFAIVARNIQVIPDGEQSKQYGAADDGVVPFTYTLNVNVDEDAAQHDEAFYREHWINGELTREAGEKVGTYAYIASTLTDGTSGCLVLPEEVENKDTVQFEIADEFVGTVTVTTSDITNRTQTIGLNVSGIEIDLANAPATLVLMKDGVAVDNVDTISITEDGDYTFTITQQEVKDNDLGADYKYWLIAGTYDVAVNGSAKEGDDVETANFSVVTVAKDTLHEAEQGQSLYSSNPNDNHLIGPGNDVTFTPGNFQFNNQREFILGTDEEIVRIAEVKVNGQTVSALTGQIFSVSQPTVLFSEADLKAYVASLIAENPDEVDVDQVAVNVTLEVCTPDLEVVTPVTDTFTYDFQAKPWDEATIRTMMNNRSSGFDVVFGETSKLNSVTVTGGFSVSADYETYDAEKQRVGLSFSPTELPLSTAVSVTVEIEDLAGNTYSKTISGFNRAGSNGIYNINILPGAKTEDGKEMVVGETNAFRLSGRAIAYEKVNISISDRNGNLLKSETITVPGTGEAWSASEYEFWSVMIGQRNAELDLPEGEPLNLTISYADLGGGVYKTILLYDTDCQNPILLTPIYRGMKVLAGYAEPGSEVKVILDGDEVTQQTDYQGYFLIRFEDGIFDSEITLEVTDLVGNNLSNTYVVPVRVRDVENMVTKAYPLGAMIQDDTGMVQLIATPVVLEDLAAGPIELPILTANFFKVGSITISQDEEGKISFAPVIDEQYQVENAETYFNVYPTVPAANALSPENRSVGRQIEAGYVPEEGAESFWFVYEAQVTFTVEQLTMEEDTEFVEIDNDANFIRFQGMVAE